MRLVQVVEVIAQGAFGNVLKVQREDDKQFYAMKVSRYGAFLLLLFRRHVWNFLTFHTPSLHFSPCLQIPKLVKTSLCFECFQSINSISGTDLNLFRGWGREQGVCIQFL